MRDLKIAESEMSTWVAYRRNRLHAGSRESCWEPAWKKGYGETMTKGAPQALQVADRWHLMENASDAFLDAVRKSMSTGPTGGRRDNGRTGPATSAERLQYESFLRRELTNEMILALAQQNVPIKEIVRRTGHSRGLVRRVLRG